MGTRYTKAESEIIEKAIIFLVTEYGKTGFNEKPVIFHSLRVACKLAEIDASATIVAGAILHDLIEDSNVNFEQIKNNFSDDVATLVDAVSFRPNISDKEERYKEMFERTKNAGQEALMIKCADILDNSDYYSFGNNRDSENLLLRKVEHFLTIAEPQISSFFLFRLLKERYQTLLAEYKNIYKIG